MAQSHEDPNSEIPPLQIDPSQPLDEQIAKHRSVFTRRNVLIGAGAGLVVAGGGGFVYTRRGEPGVAEAADDKSLKAAPLPSHLPSHSRWDQGGDEYNPNNPKINGTMPNPDPALTQGVIQYQKALTRAGFPVAVDGVYSQQMGQAVQAFRRQNKLGDGTNITKDTSIHLMMPYLADAAAKYKIDLERLVNHVAHESGFDAGAVGPNNTDFGLCQENPVANPKTPVVDMFNIDLNVFYMAQRDQQGRDYYLAKFPGISLELATAAGILRYLNANEANSYAETGLLTDAAMKYVPTAYGKDAPGIDAPRHPPLPTTKSNQQLRQTLTFEAADASEFSLAM